MQFRHSCHENNFVDTCIGQAKFMQFAFLVPGQKMKTKLQYHHYRYFFVTTPALKKKERIQIRRIGGCSCNVFFVKYKTFFLMPVALSGTVLVRYIYGSKPVFNV